MSALLGVTVSTGFVSSCLVRLGAALTTAGFEDALKDALRAADALGTDETPAPLTDQATRAPGCHNPHVYTVRTIGAYTGGGPDLVRYGGEGATQFWLRTAIYRDDGTLMINGGAGLVVPPRPESLD